MNDCKFLGRATSDVELKQTTSGKSVCHFTLAVKRPHTKDETDFIKCTAWDKTAELISKYIKKGSLFIVSGYLRNNNFADKDGNKRTRDEIKVEEFYFADARADSASQKTSSGDGGINTPLEPKTPQNAKIAVTEPQFETIDNDGDLPF